MGVSSIQTTKYTIECDICGTREVCNSYYENVHSKQQAVKWAGMKKTNDGRILCQKCFNKNRLIGKFVACNNRNSKSCPYEIGNTRCDVHEPREKRFGEDLNFYCLRGTSENPRHKKCNLVKVE